MNGWMLLFSWLWDRLIGDPRISWHPVCLFGNEISFLEKKLLRSDFSRKRKIFRGFILVVLVLISALGFGWLYHWGVWKLVQIFALPNWIGWCLLGLGMSFTLSTRSLGEAGKEIAKLLAEGNLKEARNKVGWIVGRDTACMDESEITRATVETIAENITDGIISPLFWGAVGGLPLAWVYRATNTLDSMVGYQNEKYEDFGKCAAIWDDCANFIPGRITGLLLLLVAFLTGKNWQRGKKIWQRDAAKHLSPNSGVPEAVVAGILGVRLGGENYYGGVPSKRAFMGDPTHRLNRNHILQAVYLMEGTALAGVALLGILAGLLYYF